MSSETVLELLIYGMHVKRELGHTMGLSSIKREKTKSEVFAFANIFVYYIPHQTIVHKFWGKFAKFIAENLPLI